MARTLYPLMIVLGVAIMVGVLQASGFAGMITGGGTVSDYQVDDRLEDQASASGIDGGIGGQGRDTGSTPVDFIVGGIGMIYDVAKLIIFFPYTMTRLMLPGYWAEPLGWAVELLTVAGLYQAAMGRRWS